MTVNRKSDYLMKPTGEINRWKNRLRQLITTHQFCFPGVLNFWEQPKHEKTRMRMMVESNIFANWCFSSSLYTWGYQQDLMITGLAFLVSMQCFRLWTLSCLLPCRKYVLFKFKTKIITAPWSFRWSSQSWSLICDCLFRYCMFVVYNFEDCLDCSCEWGLL